MKALCFVLTGLLAIALIREAEGPAVPLLIETAHAAAFDDMCDMPLRERQPIAKKRLNPMVNGLDKPNGDVA